jgi:hypothetical protein
MLSEQPSECPATRDCLSLTVHVEADGLAAALGEAKKLVEILVPHVEIVTCKAKRYWKFPDHFALLLDLGGEDPFARYDFVRALLAPAWSIDSRDDDELYAVWDYRIDAGFVLPSARWAHLNAFRRSEE